MRIVGYFDGSVRNQNAVGAWTYITYNQNRKHKCLLKTPISTEKGWDYSFNISSTEAECIGLINLLDRLMQYTNSNVIDKIIINGDCESIINWIKYRNCNHPILKDYMLLIKDMISQYQTPIFFNWIPREQNILANKICREVWDGKLIK